MRFDDTVWRHLPRDGHPLNWGFILEASGRWNWKRYACLYTSTSKDGVLAEFVKDRRRTPGYSKPHDICSIDVEIENVLNLTHWKTRDSLNISKDKIISDSINSKRLCKQIGEKAIHEGYNGILAPSAAIENEKNLMVFPSTFSDQIDICLGSERRNVDYRLLRGFLERRKSDFLF